MVLSYLDCHTLLRARQVSTLWRSRLSQFQYVWQRLAIQLGGAADLPEGGEPMAGEGADTSFDGQKWMRRCAFALRLRSKIKGGSCFASNIMNDVVRGSEAQVTSIDVVEGGDTFVLALANRESHMTALFRKRVLVQVLTLALLQKTQTL